MSFRNTKQDECTPITKTATINYLKDDDDSDNETSSTVSSLPWWGMSIKPDVNYNWDCDPMNPVNFSKPFVPPLTITITTNTLIIEKTREELGQKQCEQQEEDHNVKVKSQQRKAGKSISSKFSIMKSITQFPPLSLYVASNSPPFDATESSGDTTVSLTEESENEMSVLAFHTPEKLHEPIYNFGYGQHQNQKTAENISKCSADVDNNSDYNDKLAAKHRKGMIRREIGRRMKSSLGLYTNSTEKQTKSNTSSKKTFNTQGKNGADKEDDVHDIELNKKRIPSFVMV